MSVETRLRELLEERILVLDGAMGTMLQQHRRPEEEFQGYDVFNLTHPEAVESVHRAYLEAGADVISSNTFTANPVSLADFGLEDATYQVNRAGAEIARAAL